MRAALRGRLGAVVRVGRSAGGYSHASQSVPDSCPGCGVRLQRDDPSRPGFYTLPKNKASPASPGSDFSSDSHESGDAHNTREAEGGSRIAEAVRTEERRRAISALDFALDDPSDDAVDDNWRVPSGFALDRPEAPSRSSSGSEAPIVCQRCYALQHYGRVKSEEAENALPAFDFERVVGERIEHSTWSRKPVVAIVIDAVDVEGSTPKSALQFLQRKASSKVDFVVALTKCDLLPKALPQERLLHWLEDRLKESGLRSIGKGSLHVVSGAKGDGMRAFARALEQKCGHKGEAWFVGAQNAGKSSVIKCLRELYKSEQSRSRSKKQQQHGSAPPPSISHVPGTTLGLVRVDSLLPGSRAAVDTPGLLQAHQLITRLTADEAKIVLPRKPIMPKTYRIPIGHSVHIGALARIDVEALPGRTAYFTLWASEDIMTHMGTTDKATEIFKNHAGNKLQPPLSSQRVRELGDFQQTRLTVTGESWKYQSVDVSIAGLCWVSIGCDGDAVLSVWTYEGVRVTSRPALVFDCARDFEKPGFSDENTNKRKQLLGPRTPKSRPSQKRRR